MSNWLKTLKNRYKDDRFFREVFDDGIYNEVLKLGKLKTVIDLGALAGEFSFLVYDRCEKIYAIEAEGGAYSELEKNIEEFSLTKIIPFNIAISDKNGAEVLNIRERGGHSLGDSGSGTYKEVVSKTLNSFLEENNIEHVDVLKIDIEGAEMAVFLERDAKKAFEKIDFVIGEHEGYGILEGFGFKVKRLEKLPIWIANK